jgi:hypothetical protein
MNVTSIVLTLFDRRGDEKLLNFRGQMAKRPELELFAIQAFTARWGFHSFRRVNRSSTHLLLVRPNRRVYRPPRE